VSNNLGTTPVKSARLFGLLLALGYLALALIHWRHSWWALSQEHAFADLGHSSAANPILELCQTLTLAYLFALYFYCLSRWERWRFTTRQVVGISILPSLFAWSALPANSTDVFPYIGLGRIASIHKANPYLHTYSNFADHFSPYLEWDVTMPYGPVLLPVFALAGWVSQHSVLLSIFVLKLVWLLAHYGNCGLLYSLLKGWQLNAAYGLFLFALNPLLLLELLANGHNDGFLILFTLLALYALQRGWRGVAILCALLAALVKLPGVFVWAVVAAYLFWGREWRSLMQGLLGGAALLLILKATLLPTAAAWRSLLNPITYTQNSLHNGVLGLARQWGGQLWLKENYDWLFQLDRRISSALFLGFGLWRLWKIYDLSSLVRELAYIFLALLIGYTTWFFPWYASWLVPLAALTEKIWLRRAIIVFSATALALYAFPHFVLTEAPLHGLWAVLRIALVYLPPLALLGYGYKLNRRNSAMGGSD
jgi:alpha-1,6-mannosyltransferase